MKKLVLASILLTGCAGAQLKEKQARLEECHAEQGKLRVEAREARAKLAALEEVESRAAELAARLRAAESRAAELEKSNRDLASSANFSKSQLQGRVRDLVVEKDELSRRLAESQKAVALGERKLAVAAAALQKSAAEAAALKQEKEEAARAQAEAAALAEAAAERRKKETEELAGPVYDAVLKELQAELAAVRLSDSGEIAVELTESALFEPREAKLTETGEALIERLLKALPAGRAVFVEAHTDAAPIKKSLLGGFSTHLDLTSAQAAAVAQRLNARAAVGRGSSDAGRKIVIKF